MHENGSVPTHNSYWAHRIPFIMNGAAEAIQGMERG